MKYYDLKKIDYYYLKNIIKSIFWKKYRLFFHIPVALSQVYGLIRRG